jgi:hypothetical protein
MDALEQKYVQYRIDLPDGVVVAIDIDTILGWTAVD